MPDATTTNVDRATSIIPSFYNGSARRPMPTTTTGRNHETSSNSRLHRDLVITIEEGQNVDGQGEGNEENVAPAPLFFSGLSRTLAGAFLSSGTGPATPPTQDGTKDELQRTKAELLQLDHKFRRARTDNANLNRMCIELDGETQRQKDMIQSLQHELTNMGRELQEYKNMSPFRGNRLVGNQVKCFLDKIPFDRCDNLEFTNDPHTTPTDNEPQSLSAARAIVDGTGVTPVMAVVDAMLVLRKEIANISNFLAQNIRHTSYELFQEELDRCYQDSEKIVGERLSKFLCEHSEAEELNHSLIKMTIQIFITSFCAFVWDRYLDTPLHVEADKNASKGQRKAALLRNLISVFKIAAWVIPGSANRSAFEESLDPFFESVEEIEAAWTTVPEFAKISLSFVSPGEDLADFQTYAEAEVLPRIQTSIELSPSREIVLGTAALGMHCIFQGHVKGIEDRPRILLPAKVILEEHIFGNIDNERKPTTMSDKGSGWQGDGRDP